MIISRSTSFSLKEPFDKSPGGKPQGNAFPETADAADEGEFLLCANCLNMITPRQTAMVVNGFHQHTFANPSGMIYTIGCFRAAPGCAVVGEPSSEFSWFSGFMWRVVACAACQCHLGWRFSSTTASFYGLILDNLVEARSTGGNA